MHSGDVGGDEVMLMPDLPVLIGESVSGGRGPLIIAGVIAVVLIALAVLAVMTGRRKG